MKCGFEEGETNLNDKSLFDIKLIMDCATFTTFIYISKVLNYHH